MVPPAIGRLRVEGIPLAGARVDVNVDRCEVTRAAGEIELMEPRGTQLTGV